MKLLTSKEANLLASILKSLILYAPKQTQAIEKISQKINQNFNQVAFIRVFIKELQSNQQEVLGNPSIQDILIQGIDHYRKRIKSIDNIGWRMPHASIPNHPKFEEFLKSNVECLKYSDTFKSLDEANNFAKTYEGSNNHYSIGIKVFGKGKTAYALITKTSTYRDSFNSKRAIYEELVREIRKILKKK